METVLFSRDRFLDWVNEPDRACFVHAQMVRKNLQKEAAGGSRQKVKKSTLGAEGADTFTRNHFQGRTGLESLAFAPRRAVIESRLGRNS